MYNFATYFQTLTTKLNATKDTHTFCRVSGINALEDVLANYHKSAYVAIDDSDDGMTVRLGGGYFNRRSIIIFILKKYKITDMVARENALNECRNIRHSFISKLLLDANNGTAGLTYLNKERIPYHEVPAYFAAETAGVYFSFTIDEPVNLCYNVSDWTE